MIGGLNEEQIRRYSRHIMLAEVGGKGQQKLLDSKVLCIGAGGLGSPVIQYLAAAGVGTLGLVDDDVVDLIVSRCTEVESGGRMIDAILTNTVLPVISEEFLTRMMEGTAINCVHVSVADSNFAYAFD